MPCPRPPVIPPGSRSFNGRRARFSVGYAAPCGRATRWYDISRATVSCMLITLVSYIRSVYLIMRVKRSFNDDVLLLFEGNWKSLVNRSRELYDIATFHHHRKIYIYICKNVDIGTLVVLFFIRIFIKIDSISARKFEWNSSFVLFLSLNRKWRNEKCERVRIQVFLKKYYAASMWNYSRFTGSKRIQWWGWVSNILCTQEVLERMTNKYYTYFGSLAYCKHS